MAATERRTDTLLSLIREQKRKNVKDIVFTRDEWKYYGTTGTKDISALGSYEGSFESVLGEITIVDFVKGKKAPVVLDLMAPSDIVAELFTLVPDADKMGITVSLLDKRTDEKKIRDRQLNIHQVGGDIMKSTTWKDIRRLLNDRKADLIMERALAGIWHIPTDERFYAVMLNRIWNMLSDQGGMFIGEVGIPNRKPDFELQMLVRHARRNGVDLYSTRFINIVKLVKTPSSPKDLRFLLQQDWYPKDSSF